MTATFPLHLRSMGECRRIDDVASFVGADASGSFGLMANHARLMTVLAFGLARFRTGDGRWHYLALPGGLAYFVDGALYLSTRRFVLGDDYHTVSDAVEHTLRDEERATRGLRERVGRLEREALRRLWQLREAGNPR